MIGALPKAGEGAVEDERRDPLGIAGGEEHAERAALGDPEDRGPLAPGRVHHRAQIVHPHLEARRAGDAIGEAAAPLVKDDQAGEAAESVEELGVAGELL